MNDAHLAIDQVTHRYGRVTALDDVSLDIRSHELITLLGPSGCGKTTLLRVIGGFIRPTEGRVMLDGRDVTRVPPHKRPVNMVFQRSTLFPHLDVFGNVAFGLRVARVPKEEVATRVGRCLRSSDFRATSGGAGTSSREGRCSGSPWRARS